MVFLFFGILPKGGNKIGQRTEQMDLTRIRSGWRLGETYWFLTFPFDIVSYSLNIYGDKG